MTELSAGSINSGENMKIFSFVLGLFLAGSVHAAGPFSDSATSTIQVSKNSEGTDVTKIVTSSFEVVRIYSAESVQSILLKKTVTDSYTEGTEGSTGHVRLEARKNKVKTFDQLLWTIDEEAHNAAALDEDLVVTWLNGCCSSVTAYRAYNVRTGKFLLAYDANTGTSSGGTQAPLSVEVPNAPLKRYIGVLSPDASRDFVADEGSDNVPKLATLTYSGNDGKARQVDVYGPVPNGWSATVTGQLVDLSTEKKNEIQGQRMTLWTRDGVAVAKDAFNDFAIKLEVAMELSVNVVIPVINDNLDLERAILPAGYRLVRTK